LAATTLESAQAIAITNTQGGITAPRSRRSRGTLGAIVGALGGLAVAVLLTKADRRLRTREQIEQALDLQAQVAIQRVADPDASQVVVVPDRHDALSDSFRTLRSVIGFVESGTPRTDNRAPIVLVVSASSGDGKTTITSNLAAAFVETGARTIAVNADFRRPTLTKRLTGERASSHEFDLMTAAAMPPELFMRPTEHPDLAIVDLAGRVLGEHRGLHNYTLGQRRGIRVASAEPDTAYVVVDKRMATNELVIGCDRPDTESLYASRAILTNLSAAEVVFAAPQRALAAEQICALYERSRLPGGGVFAEIG